MASGTCGQDPLGMGVHQVMDSLSEGLSLKERYRAFKDDYLSTGMCDPAFNYTGDRRLALLVSAVRTELSSVCAWEKPGNTRYWEELRLGLGVSDAESAEALQELKSCTGAANGGNTGAYYLAYARFQVSTLKMLLKKFQSVPERLPPFGAAYIYKKMESLKMVRLTPEGKPDCDSEFVSFDAFSKAMQGYENLKKAGKVPSNSRYLTVVDYTKPSNSRRLMVLDLSTHRVMNQTWVAHGDGIPDRSSAEQEKRARMNPRPTPFPSQKGGTDRFGSNPKTSNEHHSNLSSLGFIRAETEYNGTWGRSLRLHGLESGVNDQMLSRGVVLHGWGVNQMSWNSKDNFMRGVKEISSLGSLEGKGLIELNAMSGRMSEVGSTEVNNATKGCLGVSEEPVKIRQSDGTFKGEMNQRDLLIELLGGKSKGVQSAPSFIFNYGGPDQESKYFD